MRVLITGGAGFIGCNLAAHHLNQGNHVILVDNLSRPRTQHNLNWLRQKVEAGCDGRLSFYQDDIRDFKRLCEILAETQPDLVVHLAGQVTVTHSLLDPRADFEINVLGTFNVLEAIRLQPQPPAMIYASTNKVYGGLEDVTVVLDGARYRYRDYPDGIGEDRPVDPKSPYGCSKCAGDLYTRDYARIYGLRTVVFRQSTIYGPRQFGLEDQGWLAWLMIATVTGRPITIYGDGQQVRDMLHVDDLIAAYDAAWARIDSVAGEVFNIGGGPANTLSIWSETGPLLEAWAGRKIPVTYADWRPGDQRVFISNNRKAERLLGWTPKVGIQQGARQLWDWIVANRDLFA
ncbi:MAG: GDP-mannose 4,6-dehydratase [Thermoflexales bacterium]|nr:GDP-mannose 4,6-dehydratase [Thermoflexales bacterium]MDW8351201.1 GDP-mannose 4,6-dehydratase [Anaerolineae bacterium]